jgi:hypothetical protein
MLKYSYTDIMCTPGAGAENVSRMGVYTHLHYTVTEHYTYSKADTSNCAVLGRGLWPLACWDWGLQSQGHGWMDICCKCCVLSGKCLYVALITRLEESYRVWCVWMWSCSLDNEETLAHLGLLRHGERNTCPKIIGPRPFAHVLCLCKIVTTVLYSELCSVQCILLQLRNKDVGTKAEQINK